LRQLSEEGRQQLLGEWWASNHCVIVVLIEEEEEEEEDKITLTSGNARAAADSKEKVKGEKIDTIEQKN
jgi:hypothetical protein